VVCCLTEPIPFVTLVFVAAEAKEVACGPGTVALRVVEVAVGELADDTWDVVPVRWVFTATETTMMTTITTTTEVVMILPLEQMVLGNTLTGGETNFVFSERIRCLQNCS